MPIEFLSREFIQLRGGDNIQPLTIDEAKHRLAALIAPVTGSERVAVADSLGRVVANDILSPIAVPAFANSAMDGFAVRHADLNVSGPTSLAIQGQSLAGHPFQGELQANRAIRIFTGAALPAGADTVVIQENCVIDMSAGSDTVGTHRVTISETPTCGSYTRPMGHDVAKNSLLLAQGTRMRAFEIASATTSGLSEIEVFRTLRIGVFATGDELRTPGEPLAEGEIYESNRIAIISLLSSLPLEICNLGILPDHPDATRDALAAASEKHDALITSGGVSVGDADFVRAAIADLGAIDFWRLNLRPGKPFAFGHLENSTRKRCLIFGLPGNPVSTIVTLLLLVKPALWHMAGARENAVHSVRVPLASDVKHSVGRHEYQRGRLATTASGTVVTTTSDQSSNRLQSFAGADCLFLVPGEIEQLKTGDLVDVLLFDGLS